MLLNDIIDIASLFEINQDIEPPHHMSPKGTSESLREKEPALVKANMCKHKSGGMSKPSGATSHDGLTERTTASISSQGCPQSTSVMSDSPITNPSSMNQEVSCSSSQMRKYSPMSAAVNLQPLNCSSISCDSYSYLPNNENPSCDSEQYATSMSFMPNVQESPHNFLESQDSDDEETEQSPMLLKEACAMYCNPTEQWHPNILPEELGPNILNPNHFNACDPYICSVMDSRDKKINCDNIKLYHTYKTRISLDQPVSYIQTPYNSALACPNYFESTIDEHQVTDLNEHSYASKHKKKWLLNQKCKSADSEPDSFSNRLSSACKRGVSPVSYNYMQGHSTNVLETHITERNTYLKPMYSNNGDPVAGPSGLQRPCSINWEMSANNVDNEFRSRSYSLTPTINFAVFESESSSESEDVQEPMVPEPLQVEVPPTNDLNTKTIDDPFELPVMSLGKVLPISPSAAQLSIASSYGDNGSPICKICHMTARENDPLISPCRCSGTMQYIHCGCLMRWLEVCHKRGRRPASCELCQYQYHWHKKFKIRHWQFPQCSRKDKILHLLFIFSVLLMTTCASLTIMFFKQDKGSKVDLNQELTQSEIGNLVCGVLFFVAFFVAIYVEAKSHDTLYKLLVKFIHINQQWYIDEYEKKEPSPVAV
ncbi:RING-CH-type domain-containing protein [Caerostris darwini]|uniref:RING-CH-type domain-containing protein n=1 Tax=Caerostris darwini TaxID=1538125 RepID=A0AAV4WPB1_9ARAC|nr:RING-CH-type domain-containing protein [Caerostris darwini]